MPRCIASLLAAALLATNLHAQTDRPILVVDAKGHTASVVQAFITADAKFFLTVSQDKTIRLWDATTGEIIRTIRLPIEVGIGGRLHGADLSPDGKFLALAHSGFVKTNRYPVYVVSIPQGEMVAAYLGHQDRVLTVAYSADGRYLASGSRDKTVRVWDTVTGKLMQTLVGHTDSVSGVSFSPNGKQLVSGAMDNAGRIWDWGNGKTLRTLGPLDDIAAGALWSPTGNVISIGTYKGSLYFWDGQGNLKARHQGLGILKPVQFSKNGQDLVIATGNPYGVTGAIPQAQILRTTGDYFVTYKSHRSFPHPDIVYTAHILESKGWMITSGGFNHETFTWKLSENNYRSVLSSKGRAVYGVTWSEDGNKIGWGNRQSTTNTYNIDYGFSLTDLEFVNVAAGTTIDRYGENVWGSKLTQAQFKHASGKTVTIDMNSDKIRVLTGTLALCQRVVIGTDYGINIYHADTGKYQYTLDGPLGPIYSVRNSPNGKYLVTGSADQVIRVYSMETPDASKDPLFSLFVAGNDWIAWTPEGYYATSPGGESLMGWHVNRSYDKMPLYHSAAQFRKTLYRPDLSSTLGS